MGRFSPPNRSGGFQLSHKFEAYMNRRMAWWSCSCLKWQRLANVPLLTAVEVSLAAAVGGSTTPLTSSTIFTCLHFKLLLFSQYAVQPTWLLVALQSFCLLQLWGAFTAPSGTIILIKLSRRRFPIDFKKASVETLLVCLTQHKFKISQDCKTSAGGPRHNSNHFFPQSIVTLFCGLSVPVKFSFFL